jgi:hypothetical protein
MSYLLGQVLDGLILSILSLMPYENSKAFILYVQNNKQKASHA